MGQRGSGSGTLVRSVPREMRSVSGERTVAPRHKPALLDTPAWGVVAAVLALVGLADTVVTQVVFSAYAASGSGANKVAAPSALVAVSLVASGLVGLLLALDARWPSRQTRHSRSSIDWRLGPGRLWSQLRGAPGRRWAAWRRQLGRLRATSRELWASATAWRREGVSLSRRGWAVVWLMGLALGASMAADIGVVAPATRPAAQWAWIGSVALLVAAARVLDRGVWGHDGVRFTHGEHGEHEGESQAEQKDTGETNPRPWLRLSRRLWGWSALRAAGWRWLDGALLGLLVAGALALRLPDLTTLPYVIHGDEAWNGLEALRWLNGGVPSLLSTGWYGLPVAGYGLPALVMRFAGANLWGLRLSSVLIGTLSIVLLYALAREFTGRRVAFLAAALLTVSHFHIMFSRMGIHYIHGLAAVLLVLWLLVRALRRASAVSAVLAAAAMSLSLQVYFSARIVFVIVPLFIVGLVLVCRSAMTPMGAIRAWCKTVGWLALGLLVAVGPLAVYFQQDPGALTGRTEEVLILNLTPYRMQALQAQFGTTDLGTILRRQLAAVPLLPGGLADQTLQYGAHYAMLDPLVAALVLIGFWYAVCTLRRPLSLLLVLWVAGVALLGGVLTIDMPSWPRLFVMLPALCLLAALAVDGLLRVLARAAARLVPYRRGMLRWRVTPVWAWVWGRRRAKAEEALLPLSGVLGGRSRRGGRIVRAALGGALVLAVVGFSLGQTIQHYFVQYPKSVNTDTYRTRYTDLAYYTALLPGWTHVILYDSGDLLLDYSTVRFLAPNLTGVRVRTPAALLQALAHRTGPVVVIVPPPDLASFQQKLGQPGVLPAGSFRPVRDSFGVVAFYVYAIP